MRRLLYAFLVYMILGLFSGFYYRELTKAHHFTGDTQLSIVHTHTLILGMFMFLILIPLEKVFKLSSYYLFNWFFIVYNISVIATIGMMVTKGTFQVLGKNVFSRSICWICRYWSYRNASRIIIIIFLNSTSSTQRTKRLIGLK